MKSAMLVVVIALVAGGSILVHITIALLHAMIGEVNSRLPQERQVGLINFSSKVFDVLRMHREFFPSSQNRRRLWVLTTAYSVVFIAVMLIIF